MTEVIRRKEKFNFMQLEEKNKPSIEEEAELTRQIFIDFYNKYKNGEDINDVFNICWNYLRKPNVRMFNPNQELVDEAMKWAEEKITQKRTEVYKIYQLSGEDKKTEIQKNARNYCVQKFFETIDINEFVKKIKPEHFIKEKS